MTNLAAGVAASASASTAEAEGRAVTLHVTKTLTMVALFGLSGSWQRAAVGLVAFDMSEWASWEKWGPYLAACSCSKDAPQRSKLQRNVQRFRI
jgi:hypothetical protein